jgi:hypothetical protein
MKGVGPDSCAVLTATTSGHPLSGATGAMEDHPTSIQVSIQELFTLMRVQTQIQLPKIMRIRIRNPGYKQCCGSGSICGYGLDPDPGGHKKITHKNRKKLLNLIF